MDKRPVPILDKDASSIEKPRQPEQKQDEVYGCENWMEDVFASEFKFSDQSHGE